MFITVNAPSKKQWEIHVLDQYPHAVTASDGTRVWAQVSGDVVVGCWSIVGGFGTVKAAPQAASCR